MGLNAFVAVYRSFNIKKRVGSYSYYSGELSRTILIPLYYFHRLSHNASPSRNASLDAQYP